MSFVKAVVENFINHYGNSEIYSSLIVTVLCVAGLLSLYEFLIYHILLRRSLYNKAFNICIALIPFFISTIILCLQSNLIVTLGTIGALAIIRFRTAVKDPVDMIFLLWSIHSGIVCGCQLYELGIVTSICVTVVLAVLNNVSIGHKSHILIIHSLLPETIREIEAFLKKNSIRYLVKSRNYTEKGYTFVIEVFTKKVDAVTDNLSKMDSVNKYSLMEYSPDDVL